MSEQCIHCILDGTDACSRGAGRAVDDEACEDFIDEEDYTEWQEQEEYYESKYTKGESL